MTTRPVERPRGEERPAKKHDYPLVIIEWVDSTSSAAWEHVVDLNPEFQLPAIHTVGFVVDERDEHITVAGSVQPYEDVSDQACNLMSIPRGCIKSIHRLRRGKPHVRAS